MDAISQTKLSNAFLWMIMLELWLKFYWSLFLRVQLTIFQHWFRWWLGAVQATSHYLNRCWFVYRRIYASLGLNELSSNHQWTCHIQVLCYIQKRLKFDKNVLRLCIDTYQPMYNPSILQDCGKIGRSHMCDPLIDTDNEFSSAN